MTIANYYNLVVKDMRMQGREKRIGR